MEYRAGAGLRQFRGLEAFGEDPLTALACQALFERAARAFGGDAPAHLSQLLIGDREAGEALVDDRRVALVSATGSTRMGREVAPRVAARFARCILELGGNNAMILAPSADLDLAVRGILFGAVGTAGQRCTTLRRLIAHESVKDEIVERLKAAYSRVRIGHPLEGNLVGPLIDERSYLAMQDALARAREEGDGCSAASGNCRSAIRMPTTCRRPSSRCRDRPKWCARRPSPRSCTWSATAISTRPCA